ncbi:acyltransferase family protein [Bradyrhizobium sp. 1(2017)]|uniref:acyltransferase family protein n=1 Tax=Bradyrhizobium sp. 1(2017) TaxID=1404888 RepID=UPI00140EA942|nr:acyltransferase family protein [Bradyrhizobium sp. 1(2017)]QIO34160.1 acyltransferase [Bradyrhizobium sp. 1(2017)]
MQLDVSGNRPQNLEYRRDIDGLRAIAVVTVLLFHYGAPLRGGFTGVDVFFVISGFLITQVLVNEIAAGTFSVLAFYDRRMRRILPALLMMLATSLMAGLVLLLPGEYTHLASSAAAAAFGVSNFFFLAHTGYFDQTADLMPLLHTWSLAVEEQFYLVWPLLLFVLAQSRSRLVMAAGVAVLVVAVCAASIFYFRVDPKSAFYMALPRSWELAIGALLVFLPAMNRVAGEIAAVAGLILIAIGLTLSPSKFPGVFALYPCIGAALIIWPRAQETTSSRVLGVLAPIGLISYSLYLWHWPIWVFYRIYINNGVPTPGEAIALCAASFAIAAISYHYVEQPFRKRRWRPLRTVGAGILSMLAILGASFYISSASGLPQRLPLEAQPMRSYETMHNWPCKAVPIKEMAGSYCVFGAPWDSAKRKSVIWGDSHAEHFAPIIEAIAVDPERSYLVFATCSAILGDENYIISIDVPDFRQRCERSHAHGLNLLQQDMLVDEVIVTSKWPELPRRVGKGDERAGLEAMRRALVKFIEAMSISGRRFVVIGSEPEFSQNVIGCAHATVAKLWRAPCNAVGASSDAPADLQGSASVDNMLDEVARGLPNVDLVFPARKLCRSNGCKVDLDGEFLYLDANHLRRNLTRQTRRDFADTIGLTDVLLARERRDERTN